MVNQELLSYIRQQLSQKVAKDVIKTNLMSQGWLDHDIAARVDKGIGIVVVLRNLLFILNFIPFIQLLGLAAIVYGGWLLGIIYIVLIISRFKQTKKIGLYNPHS